MPYSVTLTLAYGKSVEDSQDLLDKWESGGEFITSDTRQYCSVRDFNYLKSKYDNISLRAIIKESNSILTIPLWIHPLAGVTTYI